MKFSQIGTKTYGSIVLDPGDQFEVTQHGAKILITALSFEYQWDADDDHQFYGKGLQIKKDGAVGNVLRRVYSMPYSAMPTAVAGEIQARIRASVKDTAAQMLGVRR